MRRYFRLYAKFIEFSFGRAMEFRIDFYFRIVMDVFYYFVSFAFFKILYLHSPLIGTWSEPQTMIFIGTFIFVDAVNMTVFANNVWHLPEMIRKGDLDYHLVRPVASFFMLNFRDFAVNSFINLLMTVGFLTWALINYVTQHDGDLSFVRFLLFIILIINGSWLFHLMRLLFMLPVFWTHSGRGFEGVFWSIEKFAERPHAIYRGGIRLMVLTVLPFSMIASIPSEVLFGENPIQWFFAALAVSVAFFGLVIWVWNLGLKGYTSASS